MVTGHVTDFLLLIILCGQCNVVNKEMKNTLNSGTSSGPMHCGKLSVSYV